MKPNVNLPLIAMGKETVMATARIIAETTVFNAFVFSYSRSFYLSSLIKKLKTGN